MTLSKKKLPRVLSIVGKSNSGKTTFITRLIPLFCQVNLKVGTIKHTHHDLIFDQPGKDSWKHKQAGSSRVMVISSSTMAIYDDYSTEKTLKETAEDWFLGFDLVISEGFKHEDCLRIEVHRSANGKEPLYLNPDNGISALISDTQPLSYSIPHFDINDAEAVFQWICKKFDFKINLKK
ncbi:molybdopterin-guanine dinucleotide biosynthesis protein B [bacterium]|nr:molybdopterin-guanine dinucleotide biosynthesis protein B [bacterium]